MRPDRCGTEPRPFRHMFDGVLFGVVAESLTGQEHAEFFPKGINFDDT